MKTLCVTCSNLCNRSFLAGSSFLHERQHNLISRWKSILIETPNPKYICYRCKPIFICCSLLKRLKMVIEITVDYSRRENRGTHGNHRKVIANFHGHALSVLSLIKKSMKKSMSTVKAREFPEFGEHQLCVIANR